MASSSSTSSSVLAHGWHSNLPLSSDLIPYSEVPEQSSWGNYHVLPVQAGHYADPLGGVQNNNGIDSVQTQQFPAPVRTHNESENGDEWLRYLESGTQEDDIPANNLQTLGPVHGFAPPNSETWQNMVHQSDSVPSNSQQLYPSISPPAATNVHKPKKNKVRMRWTVEMHSRFIHAVNKLGGTENAKPKTIRDVMKVEGLTRDKVKSHLQKYKEAQVKNQPSKGPSIKTSNEVVHSDVQSMEELALRLQLEFQKKLRELTEKTLCDLAELHRNFIKRHEMSLHELVKRRKLGTDRTTPLSSGCSRMVHGNGSSTAASEPDGHADEAVA